MNVPNSLTLIRIVLIPVFIAAFYLPYVWAPALATGIFVFASITDWFDGYLARKLNQQSPLGAFLDPMADKLMVVSALLLLVAEYPQNNWLLFATLVIIAREIIISSLREWMANYGDSSKVAVSFAGKAKTVSQMFAISFLIYGQDFMGVPIFLLGMGMLVLAAFLTLFSLVSYLNSAWSTIRSST